MNNLLKIALFVLVAWLIWHYVFSSNAITRDTYRQSQTAVVLFTANGCAPCNAAKEFLEKRNMPFVECNVEKEEKCMKQFDSFDDKILPRWVYQGKTGVMFSEEEWRGQFFNEFAFGKPAPAYMNSRANGDLLIYTTSSCPYCAQARSWLAKNKISYTECNITVDRFCNDDLARLGSKAVPRWVYRDQTGTGFGESNWRAMFGNKS
ncbi:MAG: hypothetical protein LBB65_05530 [Burkholderiales bacterium]|jgi:glutaredoxin|nr:hypothetical protein [Burkholderiales bacterium]